MMRIQNSTESYLEDHIGGKEDVGLDATSKEATRFQIWWYYIYKNIWQDDFSNIPDGLWPAQDRTMQLIQSDPNNKYYDDKRTPEVESLAKIKGISDSEASDSLRRIKTGQEWYQVKNTTLTHLLKLPAFSYDHLKIGGWSNTINATTHDHGPSWRMIVGMDKDSIRAYGVYPGGQSGNPGSKWYGNMVEQWVTGAYNRLLFLGNSSTQNEKQIKWTIHCTPS